MPEQERGPLEVFASGEASLVGHTQSMREAFALQADAQSQLRDAEHASRLAHDANREYVTELRTKVHESVLPSTDPGDYLAAMLNIYHRGERAGDQIAMSLELMREVLREQTVPVAILSSNRALIHFGLSAGDIEVRKPEDYEKGLGTETGVCLSIPLIESFGYVHTRFGARGTDKSWLLFDQSNKPVYTRVNQSLSRLRVIDSTTDIERLNDEEEPKFEDNLIVQNEREVKSRTGFMPLIAYGEVAVSGLLATLYEARNISSSNDKPDQEAVLAAGIHLGIPPEKITEVVPADILDRLRARFLSRLEGDTRELIHEESMRRKLRNGYTSGSTTGDWSLIGSPHIIRFANVQVEDLRSSVIDGIASCIDDTSMGMGSIKTDELIDVESYFASTSRPDGLLLLSDAQNIGTTMLNERYGVVVEPAQLTSDVIATKLAERLVKKHEAFDRYQRYLQDNPRFNWR